MATTRPPKAPNLIYAGDIYTTQNEEQFRNQLRLYFNELDNYTKNTLASSGTNIFSFPHIAASDSTDQVAGGDDTPTVVKWNTLDSGLGWTLNSPGSATAQYDGVYTIRYSLQFANTANDIHYADVWIQKNGTDVDNTTSRFTLAARKSASDFTFNLGYSEATFAVVEGDEIELYWATDQAYESGVQDGIYIFHDAAQTVPYARPAIPSAIGSITFVSRTQQGKTVYT